MNSGTYANHQARLQRVRERRHRTNYNQWQREYRAKNRERCLKYCRDYYKRNREKMKKYRKTCRAKLRALQPKPVILTSAERTTKRREQNRLCCKRYRAAHPERRKASARKCAFRIRIFFPERPRKASSKYRFNHPEKAHANVERYRKKAKTIQYQFDFLLRRIAQLEAEKLTLAI